MIMVWNPQSCHINKQNILPPLRSNRFFCHPDSGWSHDQPQPGSLFQRLREAEKRDPGNEVVGQDFDEPCGPLPQNVPGSVPSQRLSNEVSLTTYDTVSRPHDINSVTRDVRNCDAYNLLVRLCRPNTDLSLSTSQNQVWTATANTYTG